MSPSYTVFLLAFFAYLSCYAIAFDPSPLQDFCVTDKNSQVLVNDFACKNSDDVNPEDFLFSGLDKPDYISPDFGSNVTLVDVHKLVGLNTIGISIARLDLASLTGFSLNFGQ